MQITTPIREDEVAKFKVSPGTQTPVLTQLRKMFLKGFLVKYLGPDLKICEGLDT